MRERDGRLDALPRIGSETGPQVLWVEQEREKGKWKTSAEEPEERYGEVQKEVNHIGGRNAARREQRMMKTDGVSFRKRGCGGNNIKKEKPVTAAGGTKNMKSEILRPGPLHHCRGKETKMEKAAWPRVCHFYFLRNIIPQKFKNGEKKGKWGLGAGRQARANYLTLV